MRMLTGAMRDMGIYHSHPVDSCCAIAEGAFSDFDTTELPFPSDAIWKKFDIPLSASVPSSETLVEAATSELPVMYPEPPISFDPEPSWYDLQISQAITLHDCMWTGTCRSSRHQRKAVAPYTVEARPQRTKQPEEAKKECDKDDTQVVAVTTVGALSATTRVRTSEKTSAVLVSSRTELSSANRTAKPKTASTAGRSLLLTSRTNAAAKPASGPVAPAEPESAAKPGSSRPETPQSLSESEEDFDDPPRFQHSLDVVVGATITSTISDPVYSPSSPCSTRKLLLDEFYCDSTSSGPTVGNGRVFINDVDDDEDLTSNLKAVSVSEVTGQIRRTSCNTTNSVVSSYPKKTTPESATEVSKSDEPAFYSDHSYHLSKNSHIPDSLGVQTPSDSEEEIDVVSLGGDKPNYGTRLSSSGGSISALPTNPSAKDRHKLQLTMASAISKQQVEASRQILRDIFTISDQTVSLKSLPSQNSGSSSTRKRSSSMEKRTTTGGSVNRHGRRPKSQRLGHKAGKGSSRRRRRQSNPDSEPDSCEKRSLHNNMERQRRIDLKNLIRTLRENVPAIKDKDKVAKVVVLNEAATYCKDLQVKEKKLASELAMMKQEQARLRSRLSQLRKYLAANR